MREGIGSAFLYNVIIVFLLILFAFLAGTLSYSKAFRVNSKILTTIEKYEGYNELSDTEINQILGTLGYSVGRSNCPKRNGVEAMAKISDRYDYCVYYVPIDNCHYSYGVTTYIGLDLPIVSLIKFPVYTESERIFHFEINCYN